MGLKMGCKDIFPHDQWAIWATIGAKHLQK